MIYYKAFNDDLCCGKLQYTVGETTAVKEHIEMVEYEYPNVSISDVIRMCNKGIHCYETAFACLNKNHRGSRFCEVSPVGKFIVQEDKVVCREIKVIREITGKELSALLTGVHQVFNANDGLLEEELSYIDGKKEGRLRRWNRGHLSSDCTYKDNKMDGLYKRWDTILTNNLIEERPFKNGKEDGLCKSWYLGGQLKRETSYKDGKRDGPDKTWHNNGQLIHEGSCKNNQEDGPWKEWNSDGKLSVECTYKDGNKEGPYREWWPIKQTMIHYKAFDKDLRCRELQYTIGETTAVEGKIEMCKNGIHCCKQARPCLDYYPRASRFCEVRPVGECITDLHMTVCRGITVVREIAGDELNSLLYNRPSREPGPIKTWYYDDRLMWECPHEEGSYRSCWPDSQLSNIYSDEEDKKNGPCMTWLNDLTMLESGHYSKGELNWCN